MTSQLQAMGDLLSEDPRYKFAAYQFIREALQYAHENLDLPDVALAPDLQQGPPQPSDISPGNNSALRVVNTRQTNMAILPTWCWAVGESVQPVT